MRSFYATLILFFILVFTAHFSFAGEFTDTEQQQTELSIKNKIRSAPVIYKKDTLFFLYGNVGSFSAPERAERVNKRISSIINDFGTEPDSIKVIPFDNLVLVGFDDDNVILSVTENEATAIGKPLLKTAQIYRNDVVAKIKAEREENAVSNILFRVSMLLVLISVLAGIILLVNLLYRFIKRKILKWGEKKKNGLRIGSYELLDLKNELKLILFLVKLLKWISYIVFVIIAVPFLFLIFPDTKHIAFTIFNWILLPVKGIFNGIIGYIPKLITIIVIYLVIRYIVKGLKYIANEISHGKLKFPGFYSDWAKPTFNIIRFLLYAFMIAIIYPYLPMSDSSIFKGISVFVGVVFSLGSTTVVGNIMSGLVITYMRSFKIGDRVKIGEVIGDVVEKTPFVIRVKSVKNEIITIPNSNVLNSQTVNYSSLESDNGLVLHTTVTIGYDVPWRQVHEILISAAKATEGILQNKEPFVLQKSLDDFYVCYEINAFTASAFEQNRIYSDLHKNIQDKFFEAKVEIMSPHYIAQRNGSKPAIPDDYLNNK